MEKERRIRMLALSTLVVVVATLSIAFAAMSRTLSINGIAKMDTASWSVYFDNLSEATTVRGASEEGKPNISVDKGTIENIKVKLSNPKDEISYTVDIVNDGTIDAEITLIKDIELTDAQKKIFDFKVTYTGTPNVLKNGDLLSAGDKKNITITIRFRDDIEPSDLPSQSQTINLSYQVTYTQYDGNKVVVGPNGGEITIGNSILAAPNMEEVFGADDPYQTTFFNGTLKRNQVKSITFLTNGVVPAEYASVAWDASQDKDGSVMAWYTDSDTEDLKDVYVGANGKVIAPQDSSFLLSLFANLTELNLENLDTSNVKSMEGMFMNLDVITNLDVSSLNTTNVTNMNYLFAACQALTSLNLSNFNTSNVTTMEGLLSSCRELQSVNLSSFDTRKVTTMADMFDACHSLVSLDLSNFETPLLTNIHQIFEEAQVLTTVDLRNADFSNITSYNGVFEKASSTSIKIIVSEEQKEKATDLFITKQSNAASLGVQVVTPNEL